ncbi:MAG: cation diffusion facilitator family transporter [Deltaproteobacteria bacterium]|nr:cation diffusion facilitator family transporter [Deltaproteobacteria bacterium]
MDGRGAEEPWLVSEQSLARAAEQMEAPNAVRLRAGGIALVVGVILLGVKYLAYNLTGSTAILSDALESIVNVAAALFALGGLVVAGWPADRTHPYGHGKIEFFSAAFEGGLITFAAILIIKEAGEALLFGNQLRQLNLGLLITVGAGLANAALGFYLLRVGRRHHSLSLVADGTHVLADFWTSVATAVGLALVQLTGFAWLDPLVAALIGLNLIWAGLGLVRHAAGGLLDEEDPVLLERVVRALNTHLSPGVIGVYFLRAVRSGRVTHVTAHLLVPEFWRVEQAHELADTLARRVVQTLDLDGEITLHTTPCHRQFCARCEIADCPVRLLPFTGRPWIQLDDAVRPDPS